MLGKKEIIIIGFLVAVVGIIGINAENLYDPIPPTFGDWYSIRANITNRQSGLVEEYFIEWYDYVNEKQRFNTANTAPPPSDPSIIPGYPVYVNLYRFDLGNSYEYQEFAPLLGCDVGTLSFEMQKPNFLEEAVYQGTDIVNGVPCYAWLVESATSPILNSYTMYTSIANAVPVRAQTLTSNVDYYEYIVYPQSTSYFEYPAYCTGKV